MKKLLLALLLLPILVTAQTGKSRLIAWQSNYGNGIQYADLYIPNDSAANILHPVIVCANGAGEVGTFNSAGNSIGYYAKQQKLPAFYNAVYKRQSTFIVITLHKPAQTAGNFEPTRYKDAIDYVYKNLALADHSQVYITGLSLSGGGVWNFLQGNNGDTTNSYINRVAAAAPITGTQDAYDPNLFKALQAGNIPFTAYETLDDANGPTAGTTAHYQIYGNITAKTYPLAVANSRYIFPMTGGHGGAWWRAYDTAHTAFAVQGNAAYVNNPNLYEWFLTKSRPDLVAAVIPPPVVVLPPPVVTVPTKKIVAVLSLYKADGTTLLSTVTVYDDGTTITK